MVQRRSRTGGDEIARSDGEQSERVRHAAFNSRSGRVKGRHSDKASRSLCAASAPGEYVDHPGAESTEHM